MIKNPKHKIKNTKNKNKNKRINNIYTNKDRDKRWINPSPSTPYKRFYSPNQTPHSPILGCPKPVPTWAVYRLPTTPLPS